MAEIVLINPQFEISYWGLEHAVPFLGIKAVMPVASLPLLAALTPPGHNVTIIDENVEPIDFARCAQADIVGVTGMNVQRRRMREILQELKTRGVFTVVVGPWVTVKENDLSGLADVIFIGEAETTWPRFLAEWGEGRHRTRYEQSERTDMTTVPAPRLELLRMQDYAFGSVQFSRGCPFTCEFCDIIVTFGRRPRLKSSAQICGIILGFDNDDSTIFAVQRRFIGEARIVNAMVNMLVAIPGTPLYARLKIEGRLDTSEDEASFGAFGTNVIPRRIGREELRRGYVELMHELYQARSVFRAARSALSGCAAPGRRGALPLPAASSVAPDEAQCAASLRSRRDFVAVAARCARSRAPPRIPAPRDPGRVAPA